MGQTWLPGCPLLVLGLTNWGRDDTCMIQKPRGLVQVCLWVRWPVCGHLRFTRVTVISFIFGYKGQQFILIYWSIRLYFLRHFSSSSSNNHFCIFNFRKIKSLSFPFLFGDVLGRWVRVVMQKVAQNSDLKQLLNLLWGCFLKGFITI